MDTSKLPKWAQEHISTLERQRDAAITALNEQVDNQTESAFYFENFVSTGERQGPTLKRFYIQTREITVAFGGIELSVRARSDNVIDLQWSAAKGSRLGHVAFVPKSFQNAELISKENMR